MQSNTASSASPVAQRPASQPFSAGSGSNSTGGGVIDPIKLLQRYKWLLLIAAIIGTGLGIAAHLVWMRTYPFYRPKATFEVLPVMRNLEEVGGGGQASNEEMNRFMMTQAQIILSGTVLSRVAEDPTLPQSAPGWASRFKAPDASTGIERFDTQSAARELRDNVAARPVGGANLLQIVVTYKDPVEATAIVRLVREKYQLLLEERTRVRREEGTQTFDQAIRDLTQQITTASSQRDKLVRDNGLDSDANAKGVRDIKLDDINRTINSLNTSVSALTERLRKLTEQRNAPVPVFGDDLEDEADRDTIVLNIKSTIENLETSDNALAERGYGPDHSQRRAIAGQIAGAKSNLHSTRRTVLERMFNAQFEQVKSGLESTQAQLLNAKAEQEQLQKQLVDIQQIKLQVGQLESEIAFLTEQRSTRQSQLSNITNLLTMDTASRVVLLERESVPTAADFPRLTVLAPLGALLLTGLVGALLIVRELVDQRIKGPSDIGLIPRTRLLGFVPDAGEDPSGQGNAETAFRDRSKGVVAESFRQLRGTLSKRLSVVDHRTILVLGGMPGSGSSTVVSNLALAYATSDRRVLILDANMRRPSQHKIMGLQEAPGLADVLGQRRPVADVVQATSTPNLDLLSAGSKELRQYERLSTQAMGDLLTQLRGMYDVVLIDCSPAIVGGDGIALAQRCDASILVVRAMAEKRGMVARLKNDLAEARAEFLGVVVNAVRASAGGYMRGNIKAASEYAEG